jgi:uncharacterized protein YjbI with pentapeptide repeats
MGLFGGLRKQSSVKHNGKRVSEIVEANHLAHTGEPGGERADLAGAQLSRVDFGGADLTDANLKGARLDGANFRRAKLSRANFSAAAVSIPRRLIF